MKRLVAMTLVLVTACAAPPPPRDPEMPPDTPDEWTAARTVGEVAVASDWWVDFGDERLAGLVREALERNPSLREAAARVTASLAIAKAVGADLYPQVGAGATARTGEQFIGKSAFADPTARTEAYGVSLNLSWEVDLWGRIRSGQAAAMADAQAHQAILEGAYISLAAQTCKAYFAAVEADRQVVVAEENLRSARGLAERIRVRYLDGLRTVLELKLAESEVSSAESSLHFRRQLLDAAIRQLETLAGRYPGGDAEIPEALPGIPEPIPLGVPADIVARRPDLVAAERILAASGARVEEARASLYPRVSIAGDAGLVCDDIGDLLKGDFGVWSLVGNLTAPLFQGGRLRANVAAREAQEEEAVASFANVVLRAFQEVETTLAAERFIEAQEESLGRLVEEAVMSVDISEDRFLAGLVNILAVLEARRRSFTSQSLHLDALRRRLSTRVDLYVALGGGFERERIELAKE